ncbi:hypothetical protein ACFL6U_03765 [Planctomycetota bacterium]
MWRTNNGDRILQGAEAVLFATATLSLLDEAIQDQLEDYRLGVACFDDLTYGQKISVLASVCNGLLRGDVPPVELTAIVEGAIATIFQHLKNEIIFEIDNPEMGIGWRKLVAIARHEAGGSEIPIVTCDDIQEWDIEVDQLADLILWDADYESAHMYVDLPPEQSRWLKDMTRVSDNYFLAIADDLTDEQARVKTKQLQKLCQSIISTL